MAVFSPRWWGWGSNNFDLTPSKKLTNHILLSSIVASLLFSPAFALPSGGKFTHGTSGTININGNTMDITGTTPNKNHVIQWGGGFSINQGEKVNFTTSKHNYLNIAHGTNKSTIAGILNAKDNNVFLINPNGVIITKTGNINANRFVASTSSMSNEDMWKFASMKTFNDGLAFSPVFKANKLGNVVNMGNINAKNVTLQGNKIVLEVGFDENSKFNKITTDSLNLKSNEVYVDIGTIQAQKTNITTNKGSAYLSATGYYYNPFSYKTFDKYKNKNNNFKVYKYVSIGSDRDWWHFAKGWNEDNQDYKNIASEYKLTNDIDFKANCKNGKCTGQNYANYWVDLNGDGIKQSNEFTNMMVGSDYINSFTKNFDGQGYTLKNINILPLQDIDLIFVGIFSGAKNATFKNINIDYMGGGIKIKDNIFIAVVGGFVGYANNTTFTNISLNNIGNISFDSDYHKIVGGFAGVVDGTFSNILLNNINTISLNGHDAEVGGFAGIASGTFSNISLNNIGNISVNDSTASAGGFAGEASGTFSNISLNNIGDISVNTNGSTASAGGFAGTAKGTFSNISLNNIGDISVSADNNAFVGGFVGSADEGAYSNISLNNIGDISANTNYTYINDRGAYAGGFAGYIDRYEPFKFKNIYMFFDKDSKISATSTSNEDHIGKFYGKLDLYNGSSISYENIHIYHHENDFKDIMTAINTYQTTTHIYNDVNKDKNYQEFIKQENTIAKPMLPIMPPPSKPDNISKPSLPNITSIINEKPTLSKDDLISNAVWNDYIIKDIDKIKYTINIRLLDKLLKEYKTLANKTEDEQVK
ncbi:filamentous hemagglutinin N-terminal domain-containing protein, partial [Campylobacter peloridis]